MSTEERPEKQERAKPLKRNAKPAGSGKTPPAPSRSPTSQPRGDDTGSHVVSKLDETSVSSMDKMDTEVTSETAANPPIVRNVYVSTQHPCAMPHGPCTLIVAPSQKEAISLLVTRLLSLGNKDIESMLDTVDTRVSPLSIESMGVTILSIGLGEMPDNVRKTYAHLPITEVYDIKTSSNARSVYYCTSHYSSKVTPAASVIVASTPNEAATFLMQKLKSMGVPLIRDMAIKEVDMSQDSVIFLAPPL